MSEPRPSATARLVALVRAGRYRFALPAEAVFEVARMGPEGALDDISLLEALGEPPGHGDWGVALKGASLRAYRVDAVEGVRELGSARFYNLPHGVGLLPPELIRGAFVLDGALALELRPEVLDGLPPATPRSRPEMRLWTEPAPKALVFTAAGRSLGFPLTQVLSVVARPPLCPVPRAGPGIRGVVEHGQTLYPVVDVGDLFFDRPSSGELGVLVEQDGRPWLVLADAVRGVRNGFKTASDGEPGWMQDERGEQALFLRLEGA